MSEQSEIASDTLQKPPAKHRRWGFWRILRWTVLAVLLLIIIAAVYAWTHRYELIENTARDVLSEQGIDGEFRIKSISKTRAVINDVRLQAEGNLFLEAETVIADYAWRDALDGKMDRLTFKNPKAWVTVDEKGKIIDGWLPPSSPNGNGGAGLPPEGIFVEDGLLFLSTPYGKVESDVSAHVTSLEKFEADLVIKPTELVYDGIKADGQGTAKVKYNKSAGVLQADIKLKSTTIIYNDLESRGSGTLRMNLGDAEPSIDVDLSVPKFTHPKVQAKNMTIQGNFIPQFEARPLRIKGPLDFTFDELVTQEARTDKGSARWDGNVSLDRDVPNSFKAEGDWDFIAANARLVDAARRRALANSLTLNSALSSAPISADFASGLTESARHIFGGAKISGKGTLDYSYDVIDIGLTGPLQLSSRSAALKASPVDSTPFYRFDRTAETLDLSLNAALSGTYPATLSNLVLNAESKTGYTLDAVQKFKTRVRTSTQWTSETPEGRPVRLEPFKADVSYDARNSRRLLSMTGGIDYDGDIPSGYVTGLKTSGRLNVALLKNGLETVFKPADQTPITIAKFETPVGWRGEGLSFNMVSEMPFFTRRGDVGTLSAELSNASGLLVDDAETRHLDMSLKTVKVIGTLKDGRQDWDIKASGIHVMSDDLPGPGTDVKADTAVMNVALVSGAAPQFELESPSADIKSRLVNADHLAVKVAGTPDNFKLDYKDGLIKFTADALPALPMSGDVTFVNGEWTGEAETFLPDAADAPIDVVYRFKDGFGEADVTIDRINFVPGKFQPQALLPALSGKVSRVQGAASADIKISFGEGQELKSSGKVRLIDMNMGTLPGPLTGMNTEIEFSSLFPLQTEGRQTLTIKSFDPGLPLENGTVEYELIPNGVKIYSARWPMGDGFVVIDPTTWKFDAEENRVTLRVEQVSLGEFLAQFGGGSIKATGDIVGVLPVIIRGIDVKVEGGVISVPDGGVIQFESRHTDAAGTVNETSQMAFDALKNFKYNALEIRLDGPLDGDISIFMDFIGYNPDVFYGAKFHFKVNISGELVNIARSIVQTQDVLGLYKKSLLADEKEPKSP